MAVPQVVELLLYPLFPLQFVLKTVFHFPQPSLAMGPIHNLHRLWEVQICDAPNP